MDFPVRFELVDRHPVETMGAFVGPHTTPNRVKVLPVVHLVDERVSFILLPDPDKHVQRPEGLSSLHPSGGSGHVVLPALPAESGRVRRPGAPPLGT